MYSFIRVFFGSLPYFLPSFSREAVEGCLFVAKLAGEAQGKPRSPGRS